MKTHDVPLERMLDAEPTHPRAAAAGAPADVVSGPAEALVAERGDPGAPALLLPAPARPLEGRLVARGPFLFRGGEKFHAKGVTYGPFRPNAAGEHYPEPERARADLALMRALSVNAIRVYYPPPLWFADLCGESGISILVGIPWSEHIAGFGERRFERRVRARIRDAVRGLRGHPAVLGHLVGNEIPSNNVRWSGPERVERFLARLRDEAKGADPEALVSYANYPSTEYLSLEPFDLYTLNLYLHDRRHFGAYLARMRNLAGHKPFLLGELGIDTIREGEARQAEIVSWSLEDAYRSGVAGAFVFAFTDEWFRGGEEVRGWAFGLVGRDRAEKPAARAAAAVFARTPEMPLERTPRVSVVVATCNGASTLRETLESLARLRYPDYEAIVVDDGSKDASAAIAEEFVARAPTVFRLIRQPNRGLSDARNRGIEAASGEVVAFIDSDAAADEHWLRHLVGALTRERRPALDGRPAPRLAGAGGPNLPPPGDGRTAAAVAAAPGGPTHVLLDDVTAEHIPGCNMAFWKEALREIGGFDPRHTAAGDDVDVCWRLQDRGLELAYAPSGIVWHHRRNSAAAYLRQQRGYGEAEAVLAFKHPGRYNALGGALWRGRIYSSGGAEGEPGLFARRRIRYGVFGTGLFQTIYQPGSPLLLELAATPEWTIAGAIALGLAAAFGSYVLAAFGAALIAGTLAVALRIALRARLEPRYDDLATRALISAISVAQPWVRRWGQLKSAARLRRDVANVEEMRAWWYGERDVSARNAVSRAFWTEEGGEREPFLADLERSLAGDHFPVSRGDGFEPFDLEVGGDRGARALVSSAIEYHGGPKRLLRLRVEPAISHGAGASLWACAAVALALCEVTPVSSAVAGFLVLLAFVHFRRRAVWLRRAVMARACEAARRKGFAPVPVRRRHRRVRDRVASLVRRYLP
jgi:GT2 family glycosyltransferase